ncbi:hypothetical protein ACFV80_16145 [Streptomyces sp. NPDC059862]|uniref:hypothetical protein n=1 Tax=Streptomyces sp. NPDC059862 TaxID=3346975 RepID=UPI003660B401
MARLIEEAEDLVLRLSWWEQLLARRREVRVPFADVKDVRIEPDWWRSLRGLPRGGRCRPGRCLGERPHRHGRDFVAVRADAPAVVVDLWPSAPFARLAVTVPDPVNETVRTIQQRRVRERPKSAQRISPDPLSRTM